MESGDPGEQRSIVRDLSSVSLELATMPLSLLLPQSRLSGLRAGGDVLSKARGDRTGVTGRCPTIGVGGVQEAGASAGGSDIIKLGFGFSLRGVVDVALVATDADRTSFGTGAEGGTSFGGFEITGVIEIEGLFICTGTSFGGSVIEMGLMGGGGLCVVVLVAEAMMIFWLFNVFIMGFAVVVYVGTVATRGGGERGCDMVVDPEGRVDVEMVIGDVKEDEDGLVV